MQNKITAKPIQRCRTLDELNRALAQRLEPLYKRYEHLQEKLGQAEKSGETAQINYWQKARWMQTTKINDLIAKAFRRAAYIQANPHSITDLRVA